MSKISKLNQYKNYKLIKNKYKLILFLWKVSIKYSGIVIEKYRKKNYFFILFSSPNTNKINVVGKGLIIS
jgi:hypothetical protein